MALPMIVIHAFVGFLATRAFNIGRGIDIKGGLVDLEESNIEINVFTLDLAPNSY